MKQDKIFIGVIISLILSLSLGVFIRDRKEVSVTENRKLEYFPKLSRIGFLNSSFQKGVEDALVDQIPMSEEFKIRYKLLENRNLGSTVSVLNSFKNKSKDSMYYDNTYKEAVIDNTVPKDFKFEAEITPWGNNIFEIDQTNNLIYPKMDINIAKSLLKSKANNYNQLARDYPEFSFHCNYIESDIDLDFINGEISHDLVKEFYSYLDPSIKKSALYLNHPLEFPEYFYKTDHHWNVKGQLQGYKTIMKNLKSSEVELLDIKTVPINGIKYNGSKSKKSYNYKIYDNFEILVADLPKYKTYINGQASQYGNKKNFIKGNFKKGKGLNYYAEANGGDAGVVKYEFENPKEQNLLVFVDSFSNPIKEFIASNYNNTYFVDLRYYEKAYGKKFDFGDFVKGKDIDQVLYTNYIASFLNGAFLVTD